MKNLFIFLLSFVVCGAHGQIITTVAGNGSAGYTGDGGPATAAQFNHTSGLWVDRSGNLYIGDDTYSVIRKVSTTGVVTTIAGTGSAGYTGDGGPATAAQINYPENVAVDNTGNVYIADSHNHCIRKVDLSGTITTIAGLGGIGYTGDGGPATAATMYNPTGMAFDNSGNLYVADYGNFCIRKINTSGIISTFAGDGSTGFSGDGGPATAAKMNTPQNIAIDNIGNLYIADFGNSSIRKVDTSGIITTIAGTGSAGFSGDGGPATAAQINPSSSYGIPWGSVFVGSYGDIYISDIGNNRIRRIDNTGTITTVAGTGAFAYTGDGGPATAAAISYPVFVCVDNGENLYISEPYNYVVRKVTCAPSFISDSFKIYIDKYCSGPRIRVAPNRYTTAMSVKTYFGDGATDSVAISSSGTALFNYSYNTNGTYSIRQVLYNSGIAIDSLTFSYDYKLCNSFSVNFYLDRNSNCIDDSADITNFQPLSIEIDSNGIPIDTISATSGLYYTSYGTTGDIYAFKVVAVPYSFHITCPTTGIVFDTLSASAYSAPSQMVGIDCTTSSAFDLSIYSVIPGTGRHLQSCDIYVQNHYCTPITAMVSAHCSPKYLNGPTGISPSPVFVSGNLVLWSLSGMSSFSPGQIHLHYEANNSTFLTVGDTVHSDFIVTPTTGDADTTNNTYYSVDTVRAGFDPNEMAVKPASCIPSGTAPTELQYTINFENTGNDTAHNIYVMDTLSGNVDVSSMRMVMSSHEMYISKLRDAAGHNILKFDFPGINLLDSSHHGKCDGAVIFNIKTKAGLTNGTNIANRAGIYFDDNEVVMTNQVVNTIGCIVNEVTTKTSNTRTDIYPNPANDVLNIRMADGAFESFTITNSIGTEMLAGQLTRATTQLNIQSLPPGLYFVNLRGQQGVEVLKFLKR